MEVPDFDFWDETGSANHTEFCHPGTALSVKTEEQHHHYTGRFPESKHKPGLGMKPFIVISVFVKSVARSDKPLFSSSKC